MECCIGQISIQAVLLGWIPSGLTAVYVYFDWIDITVSVWEYSNKEQDHGQIVDQACHKKFC